MIPQGWSRIAISDKSDPWFDFYVSAFFEKSKNYIDFDRGLLTFVKNGTGEEWKLLETDEQDSEIKIPNGWKMVGIDEHNIDKMRPRMGYLLLDAEFDEEKYKNGLLKFLLKESTERTSIENIQQIAERRCEKYDHIHCWIPVPIGWEELKYSDKYTKGLNLHSPIMRDFQAGRRKIIKKK